MTGPKESHVEDYLVEQVTKHGGFAPKTVWLGRRGCPDREACWPDNVIDKIETKRPVGGRYEPGQERAHKELAARGVPVLLINTREKVDRYIAHRTSNKLLPDFAVLGDLYSVEVA